jgi:hypothetical protein
MNVDCAICLPGSASDTVVCDSKHPSLGVKESELNATKLRHSTSLVDIGLGGVKSKTAIRHMSLLGSQ